jgi:membrane associated rhomboid family serine protease
MLQIIGWLGCMMLFVYSARLALSPDFRNENGHAREGAMALVVIGMIASVVFAILLWGQGTAFETIPSVTTDQEMADALLECLKTSDNPQEC